MPQVSPELERRLMDAVERMPAFPKSVQAILDMSRNLNCSPKSMVAVIEKDPVMTVKILRVINSAYYSLPNKVNSVGQSVVYLGINTVKNLALAMAAVGILPRFNAAGFDIQRYLLHSLTVAAVARLLCEKYAGDDADPGDCYVAGLLHDFGKVVFAQFMSAEFALALARTVESGAPLHGAETEIIGADHAYVGALLAKRWQFGTELVNCIRDHHAPDAAPAPMLDCLRLADALCRKRAYGNSGNPWRDGEQIELPARFGGDVDAVVATLGDLEKVVEDASRFAQIGTEA